MDRFTHENRQPYTDVSTVESQRNDLAAEEFAEGSYGSPQDESLGKSKPWRIDQRSPNPYSYEYRALHEGMSRDYPGEDDEYDADAIPDIYDDF